MTARLVELQALAATNCISPKSGPSLKEGLSTASKAPLTDSGAHDDSSLLHNNNYVIMCSWLTQ